MATIIIKPMFRFVANTSLMPDIHICQVLETFGPSRQTSKTDAALTKVKLQIYQYSLELALNLWTFIQS